jgi:20S proteasome subunit beta 4
MDCLIGFTGKDFAILAADGNAARSIMVYSQSEDKILQLDSHKLLAVGGDAADCIQEPDFFKKNMDLYAMRNGVALSTQAAANYMRGEKSTNLRKKMSVVDMLLAGYDEADGPSLYFLDYLASMQKLDKAAHGYGGFFVNSLLDAHWRADLSEAEALDLLECCFAEIKKRFMVSMPKFTIKVVDANGVRIVDRATK